MKNKPILLLPGFLLILSLNSSIPAQNLSDFLPLQVGNVWVYDCGTSGSYCGYCSGRTRISISGSSVINGKIYYQQEIVVKGISGLCYNCGSTGPFGLPLRVDSLSVNVYYSTNPGCSYTPGEILLDSFRAKLGDTIRDICQYPILGGYICTDTNAITLFGSVKRSRIYRNNRFEGVYQRSYAMGIGCYYAYSSFIEGSAYPCNRTMTLKGCVINGILYGDTSMPVGINQISTEIPSDFGLSQNYPNPFNPVTNIRFDIPKSGYVKIIIYDLLGREITQLVNQQMQPGSYSVDWDASSYPSGVYFYKLVVGDNTNNGEFVETRKMVLVK